MRGKESLRRILAIAALALLVPVTPLPAQDQPLPILTLDQDRLFIESAFGKASLERERIATEALEAENARIEAELTAEEQDLTDKRPTLTAEEFAALADGFDQKVESIRQSQDTKARDIGRARDADRQAFLRAAIPVLGDLIEDKGAVAMIDKAAIILSLSAIDVTDEAIARVDAALGSGAGEVLPESGPESGPETGPETGPQPEPPATPDPGLPEPDPAP
jgi:Skp family chaperone for outer membrane proteins